ncbi:hypothetical protein LINPERHAP2_LOCUS33764 [Linum perenne]
MQRQSNVNLGMQLLNSKKRTVTGLWTNKLLKVTSVISLEIYSLKGGMRIFKMRSGIFQK